jgi:predicted O-linked N-acetylglucosamine transferase (SPINDLY family)
MGRRFVEQGLLAEAVNCFRQVLAVAPANATALYGLGDTLRMLKMFAEAETHLSAYLLKVPNSIDGLLSLALTQGEIGRFENAEGLCRRALKIAPGNPIALYCLGNVLMRTQRLDEARDCFVAGLQANPSWPPALECLGNVLTELGNTAKAEECYRQCLEVDPGFTNASNNLGRLLVGKSRFAEAEKCFRHGLAMNPHNPVMLELLGNVLIELGRCSEARDCYLQALSISPTRLSVCFALAASAIPVTPGTPEEAAEVPAQFSAALDELSRRLDTDHMQAKADELANIQLPFFLAYRDGNHRELLSRYGDLLSHSLNPRGCQHVPGRDKIRLVIVSQHICFHSVWSIVLRGLLSNLDRDRFEVFIYHLGNTEDQETVFARGIADGWRDRHTIIDAEAWLTVAEKDCPDVIFYPEIGMASLSYFLAAHRLAPLQVAGWGHPITSGLASIDLFFSGELLEAADAARHYRERLICLPGTGCCTSLLKSTAQPIEDIEAILGEKSGVRFLIAQRAIKFDPDDAELYTRVALSVGRGAFIFLRDPVCPWATDQFVKHLEGVFQENGLDPAQFIVVIPWLAHERFLALLDSCDVYLDTPGFSGYTTAWFALHRGLPIVTREGRYMRQRLAAGLLRLAGLTDTIAATMDEYVAMAARLAGICRDPQQRSNLRSKVRDAALAVDDDVSVVRAFEKNLIQELEARL